MSSPNVRRTVVKMTTRRKNTLKFLAYGMPAHAFDKNIVKALRGDHMINETGTLTNFGEAVAEHLVKGITK